MMGKNKASLNSALDEIEECAESLGVQILQAEPEEFMGTTFEQDNTQYLKGGKN